MEITLRTLLPFLATVMITCQTVHALAADNELLNFKEGSPVSSFTLPELTSGKPVTVEPSSGKPLVIMFFSVTPQFREQRSLGLAESLTKLNAEFHGRVNFSALFSDNQGHETVKRYIQDGLITIPVLDDSNRQVYERYGVFMMPLAILIAGDGTLQAVVPYTSNSNEIIANNLKYLLGDWSKEKWQDSFKPQQNTVKSKEEQEYIRRVNYGRVMLSRKMYSSALREFMTASKIMPKATEAHVGLGKVQFVTEKLDQAEESFRAALAIDKDLDEALSGLGLVLYKKGALDKAIPILENALISAEPQIEVIMTLADFYEKNGLIDKAICLNKLAVSRLLKQYD